MSTTIYNGIKFNTNNIEELNNSLMLLSEKIKEQAKEEILKYALKNVIRMYDQNTFLENNKNLEEIIKDELQKILDDIRKNINNKNKENPLLDFEFNVSLFFLNKEIYGIFFGKDSLSKELFKSNIAKDFCYFNNTDKPDDVTTLEWRKRQKVWDKIFEKSSIPSQAGFTKTVFDGFLYITYNDFINYAKKEKLDFDKRITEQSNNILTDKLIKEKKLLEDQKSDFSGIMDIIYKVKNDETKEIKQEKESLKEILKNKLVKNPFKTITNI